MESGNTTDYTYVATTDSKIENSVKEPKAPEGTLLRQVQDAKESITVLKNQVSFADQCLSLLHNQMKHASDTLAILQDQVDLAQKTVNSLSLGTVAGVAIPHPQATVATPSPTTSQSHPSWVTPRSGESDEQRVFVHDSDGPKVYTLSKSSISLGNSAANTSECPSLHGQHGQVSCVMHQVPVHCHCAACLSHATVHHVSQPCHSSCHGPPGTAVVQVSPEMPPPPKTDETSSHAKMPHVSSRSFNKGQEHDKDSSTEEQSSAKKESASTSPMAHQLLQVIDVLQTEDDDNDKGVTSRPAPTSLVSLLRGVTTPHITPYGHSAAASWHGASRRNRKQNMSPVKVVSTHSSASRQSSVRTVSKEHPELMRVPAPVLASTLEPEFLVVPTSSFSYDSPPTSAIEDGGKDGAKSSEILLVKKTVTSSSHKESPGSITVTCSTKTLKSVEVQDCNSGSGKKGFEECRTDGCSGDKSQPSGPVTDGRGHFPRSPPSVKKQGADVTIDLNGVSLAVSPKKKMFTGTSPLNSDIGMPYTCKLQSPSSHNSNAGRNEPIVTIVNDTAEPVSLADAVSHLEHAPVKTTVLSTDSQVPPMTVISLPSAVEGSANSAQKTTTPTSKKPIILSRRSSRSSEQNIPQGLVVLVPTIADAKRLIASTGGQSDGHTPVLVPQHMLNEIHSKNAEEQLETQQQLRAKRNHDMVSPPCSVQSKRPAIDSVVID